MGERTEPGRLAADLTRLLRTRTGASVAVEGPRWMHEQSVCVTAHRYGNVGAGPQPAVPGAGL